MRRIRPLLLAAPSAALAATACTTFSSVRSAAPPPGPGVHFQFQVSSPPGDEAAWFWRFDCAANCNGSVGGAEVLYTYGVRGADSTVAPITLGIGLNGIEPEVEVYWRVGRSAARPFGVGVRASGHQNWRTYQLFGRADLAVAPDARLLWNPGVFIHMGSSPNGENDGTFVGLVQALGVEAGEGPVRFRPSVSYVLGRTTRESYGRRSGPVTQGFGTFSLGFGYERGRR